MDLDKISEFDECLLDLCNYEGRSLLYFSQEDYDSLCETGYYSYHSKGDEVFNQEKMNYLFVVIEGELKLYVSWTHIFEGIRLIPRIDLVS